MHLSSTLNKTKVFHVFDDDKFIDPAIKLFEKTVPGLSEYFIIASNQKSLKYVKSKSITVLNFSESSVKEEFVNFINDSDIKVVFFHALNLPKQLLVNSLKPEIVKVWFIWGYDLYGTWMSIKRNLYSPKTKQFVKENSRDLTFKNKLLYNQFSLWLFLKRKKIEFFLPNKILSILNNRYDIEYYNAVKNIDIVVPVVPTEYKVLKKLKISPKLAPFSYLCIEDIFNNKLNQNVLNSRDILIGNSGNPTNNHVDAFNKLRKLNLGNRKIIVPLNYGGTKKYIDFVIEKGTCFFGENFVPLLNFMPLEEYNKILSSCGFAIFNHIRQQAVGNIIALAYSGTKIFLNKKSPVYFYYNTIGSKIYTTDSINQLSLETNLSVTNYKINQKVFYEVYSEEAVKNKIRNLLKTVNNEVIHKATFSNSTPKVQ
ncbi:TDP-N-acetylfucosamine:lipid II N-acetylfucosaminyltransferase [Lacinutrix venerupis]|uniref:4-alpha-L-fucosyltransferase (Glycosyl transferase family 56) n=1 Tax=Lacinutrix venerupis TaxID=1486034 RepID=A0AAC9LL80_9FLAO|nr:TDP-N-acetylfucosamine:lipid II N-acetylfucosaminyltransferase [Lacinutrix venerupis]APY00736.1 hypothetical protein BWR22_10565 [Lacinutrix venerupis]